MTDRREFDYRCLESWAAWHERRAARAGEGDDGLDATMARIARALAPRQLSLFPDGSQESKPENGPWRRA